jgi:hypothetical protein
VINFRQVIIKITKKVEDVPQQLFYLQRRKIMHISTEGWIFIGLAALLILAAIGSAIYVMKRYPPEFQHPEEDSMAVVFLTDGHVEILDDIMDDD